jgi:hypothetical protein
VLAAGILAAAIPSVALARQAAPRPETARAAPPIGAPPPSAWAEAEARMDADGPARAIDLLLGATAAGGWIEERRGELVSADLAVLRRVRAWPAERQKYWTERAGLPAGARLAVAGEDVDELARLARTAPATVEGGLAALRLHDAALERGQPDAARDWLDRAAEHGADDKALTARRAHHARRAAAGGPADAASFACSVRALLERRASGPRHQGAGGAALSDGGCVAQHGDLLLVAQRSAADEGWTFAEHDLRRALEARHDLELPRAHGSAGVPGMARPALFEDAAGRILVVAAAGRAEDERGNALGCWRLDASGLEVAWSSLDAAARVAELEGWTIEHAGTPLVSDGRVLELLRAWPGRVDDARVRGWLVARALVDGSVLSATLIDEGPVERAALRDANAVQPWRADPPPEPALAGGSLLLPTGTGALWRVGLARLDLRERLWTPPAMRPSASSRTVAGAGWAPREGGWRTLAPLEETTPPAGAWQGLLEPLGAGVGLERIDAARVRLARSTGEAASPPIPASSLERPVASARGGRIWVASQGRAYLHDEALLRRQTIDLPGSAAGLHEAQEELGWIPVARGAWLVRSRSLVFVGE